VARSSEVQANPRLSNRKTEFAHLSLPTTQARSISLWKKDSVRRKKLKTYIARRVPRTLQFYAEEVWYQISKTTRLNALQLESKLAELTDAVLIVVESPGTFAELGAFSLNDDLRWKLLPILNQRHRGNQSFLETGPIKWVDADSMFAPSIWCNFDRIIEAGIEIENRLLRAPEPMPARDVDLSTSTRHLFQCSCAQVWS